MSIKEDLEQLREILANNPRDLKHLKGREKEYLKAVMIDNYAQQDVVKWYLEYMAKKIDAIDGLLKTDREMKTTERKLLFDKRDVYREVIMFFQPSKETVKKIEDSIKREVNKLREKGF